MSMNPVERLPSRYKPYLWVVGEGLESLPIGELVQQRYRIEAPCLWLDTQPEQRPDTPDTLPEGATPYLKTHDHRLHVPGLYGVLERTMATPILLLDNAPIHPQSGELFPDIETGLYGAPPRRQINWLWQMWELWETLGQYGVATSLLTPANLRVEGWRIRLRELRTDDIPPALEDLAQTWRSLLAPLHISVAKPLTALLDHIEAGAADPDILSSGLNDILLAQTAAVPARITLAGATTTGPTQPRNEDACWPVGPRPSRFGRKNQAWDCL
ncbi:MAG: hypothetical protein HC922_07365 [Leptolyngbyaceae cyanobacterium SM2_3_12]|nr:hypothetical protein [Leptolyngbyaceae cyanobacterium SM2_3_12]